MMESPRYTLSKEERICSKLQIERLFNGGCSHSMVAFPIRAVYLLEETNGKQAPVSILASVPKRCFKRAVKRNRVKRQVREAYRLNKHSLIKTVQAHEGKSLMIAFIYLDNQLHPSQMIESKVKNLLVRIGEKIMPMECPAQQAETVKVVED